jgi:hypothetical protein
LRVLCVYCVCVVFVMFSSRPGLKGTWFIFKKSLCNSFYYILWLDY